MAIFDNPRDLLERLDEIAAQGRQNASNLELISTKLFGSEEDHFAAGRLPVLERGLESLTARLGAMEHKDARLQGQRKAWSGALSFVGKAILAAGSALMGAVFGAHFHK